MKYLNTVAESSESPKDDDYSTNSTHSYELDMRIVITVYTRAGGKFAINHIYVETPTE